MRIRSMTPSNALLWPAGTADGRDDAELFLHLVEAGEEVGAHAVELVDVGDAGHPMLVGLIPDRFALHFDAADGEKTPTAPSRTRRLRSTSAVKSTWPGVSMMVICVSPQSMATAALLMVMPLAFSSGVEVGGGVAVVHVADFVLGAAEEEDALRRRRFPAST